MAARLRLLWARALLRGGLELRVVAAAAGDFDPHQNVILGPPFASQARDRATGFLSLTLLRPLLWPTQQAAGAVH